MISVCTHVGSKRGGDQLRTASDTELSKESLTVGMNCSLRKPELLSDGGDAIIRYDATQNITLSGR